MIDSGKNGQFLSYSKAEEAHRSHTYCSVGDVFLKEPFQPQRWTGIFCLIGLCMSAGETQLEDIKEDWNSLTQMRPLPGCQKSTYFPSVSSEAHVKWGGGGRQVNRCKSTLSAKQDCSAFSWSTLSHHSASFLKNVWGEKRKSFWRTGEDAFQFGFSCKQSVSLDHRNSKLGLG